MTLGLSDRRWKFWVLPGAVQRGQIQEAAKKYLTENNKTVGKLIPEGGVK